MSRALLHGPSAHPCIKSPESWAGSPEVGVRPTSSRIPSARPEQDPGALRGGRSATARTPCDGSGPEPRDRAVELPRCRHSPLLTDCAGRAAAAPDRSWERVASQLPHRRRHASAPRPAGRYARTAFASISPAAEATFPGGWQPLGPPAATPPVALISLRPERYRRRPAGPPGTRRSCAAVRSHPTTAPVAGRWVDARGAPRVALSRVVRLSGDPRRGARSRSVRQEPAPTTGPRGLPTLHAWIVTSF